jgi:GT2 family glycosyltransferase
METSGHTAVPPITIVTPSFNQAVYLGATLYSVSNQDIDGLEYFVIDGGSTDASVAVIRRHETQLTGWVSEADKGQAAAINKGLRRAHSPVLAWLNADDTYKPGAVQAALEYLSGHPHIDLVYGDVEFTDADGESLGVMPAWEFDRQLLICATNLIPQPAAFFRRALYERVGGLDEALHLALDYDLWVRMTLAGARCAHVSQVWATYRLHPSSKTQTQAAQFVTEVRRVVEKAFASGGAPAAWRPIAESNLEQLMAETYMRLGQPQVARRHFWRAVRSCPWRLKSITLLAFAIDARLGRWVRRLRWWLAGRREMPLLQIPMA